MLAHSHLHQVRVGERSRGVVEQPGGKRWASTRSQEAPKPPPARQESALARVLSTMHTCTLHNTTHRHTSKHKHTHMHAHMHAHTHTYPPLFTDFGQWAEDIRLGLSALRWAHESLSVHQSPPICVCTCTRAGAAANSKQPGGSLRNTAAGTRGAWKTQCAPHLMNDPHVGGGRGGRQAHEHA